MRAQNGIDASLDAEITGTIARFPKPTLCTCTTIGPVAEAAGALRVDWPMMQRAARVDGPVLLAHCLDSTFGPSRDLLLRAMDEAKVSNRILSLPLSVHWKLFEAGDHETFRTSLARDIRKFVATQERVGAVVLAQASMAAAEAELADLDVPVLSSPELALRAVLARV